MDENKSTPSEAEEGDGVPDVPEVQVEGYHWKVGDGMVSPEGKPLYVIGQIAVVEKGNLGGLYDIVFFDTKGLERGRLHLRGL